MPAPSSFARVILFTGHRIDSPTRQTPRFPPSMEPFARQAIRAAVARQQQSTSGPVLGIAGGASGGDILFLEVCEELEIPTEMLLALPAEQFAEASVSSDGESWLRRFAHQLALHPNPPVLSESSEMPSWLSFEQNYSIWQRNNLWLLSQAFSHGAPLTLIALWDGQTGDGPGGTEHMVTLAKEHGAEFVWLKTQDLAVSLGATHSS